MFDAKKAFAPLQYKKYDYHDLIKRLEKIHAEFFQDFPLHFNALHLFDMAWKNGWIYSPDHPNRYEINSLTINLYNNTFTRSPWNLECGTDGFYIHDENKKLVAFIPSHNSYDVALKIFEAASQTFAPR